ncbi:uncharacterized protein LOC120072973 [Benincasa hispida]|uniref:uncharacterized protein LOC120072973 n=1 Tax=Benincasa hispida TaxID=102211 RepID=UPI0019005511|nr:uncharacterized protein LOC120072973 [Benincasa hispida]
MGNEMGNNNTSEFREEEKAKSEGPEKSLPEGGANEVEADEVAGCLQKEARPSSGEADRENGDHVTEKEEKNKACNIEEFQMVPKRLPDRTKEDNEVDIKCKEYKEMEFDSEENRSNGNEHEHEKQASNQKEEQGERGSNLNTAVLSLGEPGLEKITDFKGNQHELLAESLIEDSNKSPEECKDALELSLNHSADCAMADSEENTNMDQVIDTDRDTDRENDGEKRKGSNFDMITYASKDPNSENSPDLKSMQHESSETNAKSLTGSSDDGDTDMEKKKGDLVEPRPCHGYTIPAAKNVDTKDEGTAIDLICHNSSCSLAEESLVIESPKSFMQVPEVEERCTVLKEEFQLREEHLGTETVVQDNIPTQSKISNGVQGEFNTIGSHSENSAEKTEVFPEFVAKSKNEKEAPGEDCEDSDGEYLEISEQGTDISNLSIGDYKHKHEDKGETTEVSTNNGHEGERREPDHESLFEPVLGFQHQIQQKETSITFQTAESTAQSISAPRQETCTVTEKSKYNPSDSPSYIQTASATLTETKPSTNPMDEQSFTALPFSTFGGEDQESPGRTSNESTSENSIGHIEMRKSPSFNIDIQSEGREGETEKTPLLYQIKTIEDLPNLQEISFPNPMEKRVVKLGRSDSENSRPSFPGFAKEREEPGMEFKAIDQNNFATDNKAAKDLPPPSPIRKGKRRTKSLIFGTCICCATAIN